MKRLNLFLMLSFLLCLPATGICASVTPKEFLAKMPVKEVTIFKDGHAFVRHEGSVATNENGDVVLDYLPRPVVGTFWAYSADGDIKLKSVTAGKKLVSIDRTALSIPELIEANVGKKVRIREKDDPRSYDATILRIPTRSSEEIQRTSAAGAADALPRRGDVVMLKIAEGVSVVPIAQIEKITFLDTPEEKVAQSEYRNVMTLKLDHQGRRKIKNADVGMFYLQRGVRWIPNYKIDIDGQGNASVKLQATLINELTDLLDVTAHLVIGVPTFAFKDTVDPISLQQTIAQLSTHFQRNARNAYAYSNAIMSQSASYNVRARPAEAPGDALDLGPDLKSGTKNEDLYVFTVEHLTLKKGERMVMPVVEFELKYSDVYIVNLPFSAPPEARHNFNNEQQAQLAALMHAPKATHSIRLINDSKYPITTAPALILRNGRLIAQGMTKYTAVGARGDLDLTTAVDISVKKTDTEAERTPNAVKWGGYNYTRCNLNGKITLTSHKDKPVDLEVRRFVLGNIDTANSDGRIEHLGWNEGGWTATGELPFWWNWYRWPYWWHHFNPVGRTEWDITLQPGKTVELEYAWHYFWRD